MGLVRCPTFALRSQGMAPLQTWPIFQDILLPYPLLIVLAVSWMSRTTARRSVKNNFSLTKVGMQMLRSRNIDRRSEQPRDPSCLGDNGLWDIIDDRTLPCLETEGLS